jgi:hypothetical protein
VQQPKSWQNFFANDGKTVIWNYQTLNILRVSCTSRLLLWSVNWSICPLELRAGIINGYFTPRAARQAGFVMAQLTSGESEALFAELENMRPSRSSLDRLPKALSPHWESQRSEWEAALREQETVPTAAAVVAISVDGVMAPIKGGDKSGKQNQPGKHASGPTGYKEVGCGTVVLYNDQTERLQTVRYTCTHRRCGVPECLRARR